MYKNVGKRTFEYRLIIAVFFSTIPGLLVAIGISTLESSIIGIVMGILFFILLMAVNVLIAIAWYKNSLYKLDDNSLEIKQGLLSIHTTSIPFSKITNIRYEQDLIQRILGVGNIIIDQEDAETHFTDIDSETFNLIHNQVSDNSNVQKIKTV